MGKAENTLKTNKSGLSKNKCASIKNYCAEYTRYTSLPCFQYLGENKRSVMERIFWFLLIVASIAVGSYFIWKAYKKWDESPILIAIADVQPIEDITFPAVTVCPATKINDSLMEIINKFKRNYPGNVSESDKLLYKYVNLWCTYDTDQYRDIRRDLADVYDLDILKFIYKNNPSIYDVFEECKWNDHLVNCSHFFTPTFTEEGVCYTFNSLNHSDIFRPKVITFENFNTARKLSCLNEYQEDIEDCNPKAYPYRLSPQNHFGLEFVLKMAKNHSSPCTESERGHKIIIHLYNELPRTEDNKFFVNPYETVNVELLPELTITDEDLRSYRPLKRKCFFDDEKDLTYFKYYTQNNCQRECFSTLAKLRFNCSTYFMPHEANTSICNAIADRKIRSLARFAVVNQHKSGRETYMNLPKPVFLKLLRSCKCFPLCRTVKYNFETTCIDCNQRARKRPKYKNKNTTYYSKVQINFKNIEISPFKRYAQFSHVDFMAYCGGLLGFFIGFTFISLWEIFYFFCCRPLCNMFLYGRKFWMGRSGRQNHSENLQS